MMTSDAASVGGTETARRQLRERGEYGSLEVLVDLGAVPDAVDFEEVVRRVEPVEKTPISHPLALESVKGRRQVAQGLLTQPFRVRC